MAQLFADSLRHPARHAVAEVWVRTLWDVLLSVVYERKVAIMTQSKGIAGKIIGLFLGLAVVITLMSMGVGGDLKAAAGLFGAVLLVLLAIVGIASLVQRRMSRPTEAAWEQSTIKRHWWTVPALLIAAFYLFIGVKQWIEEPRAGNLVSLGVAALFAGAMVVGIVLRSRRPGTVGTWLVLVGVLPGAPFFWFVPVPVATALVIVGTLAEIMGSRGTPRVNHAG